MLKLIKSIEKNIQLKMKQIGNNEITVSESKIGVQFNKLKDLDEVSYEKLLKEYIRLNKNK